MIGITAAPNVMSDTLNILKDNWKPENTDDVTPDFFKITEVKREDFWKGTDKVMAHRPTSDINPAGIGEANKHEFENFNLDVRVLGRDKETHFLNIIREIKRIFKSKKVNPLLSKYPENHVLEFDGAELDLSDKTHWLWRKMFPAQFKRYNVIR